MDRGLMIDELPQTWSVLLIITLIAIITSCFVFVPGVIVPWVVTFVVSLISVLLGRHMLSGYQVLIPIALVLAIILSTSFIAFLLKYVFIERQKSAIRKAFGRYLDERVVRDIERR